MYKVIALIGEAGSGKDTLLQEILKKEPKFHEVISFTTRPPREGEKEGKSYFFITSEKFAEKILNFEMFEIAFFNNWIYGIGKESIDEENINITILNPDGVYMLLENPQVDLMIYYVRANPKTRLLRQLNREENPDIDEIIRRYKADLEDFSNLDFNYIAIANENKEDLSNAADFIISHINLWNSNGQ